MTTILNNQLRWDGNYLGSFLDCITNTWLSEGIHYYSLTLPDGWSPEFTSGIIYCTMKCTKGTFPCIVEEIKPLFGIRRRGIHRITINYKEYILYFVPISLNNEIIWETPLVRLDGKHLLRKNSIFRHEVQKIIAFCDVLALCNTNESCIRIRQGTGDFFVPVAVNDNTTSISKKEAYDYSILTKTIFNKWFGEETAIDDIVKEIAGYQSTQVPSFGKDNNNLVTVTTTIRDKIDNIIRKYDTNYIWYSYFIIDRLSRHLLNTH